MAAVYRCGCSVRGDRDVQMSRRYKNNVNKNNEDKNNGGKLNQQDICLPYVLSAARIALIANVVRCFGPGPFQGWVQ
jgi:hypothetical protein